MSSKFIIAKAAITSFFGITCFTTRRPQQDKMPVFDQVLNISSAFLPAYLLHELIRVLLYEYKPVRSASSPWNLKFLILSFAIIVNSQVKLTSSTTD